MLGSRCLSCIFRLAATLHQQQDITECNSTAGPPHLASWMTDDSMTVLPVLLQCVQMLSQKLASLGRVLPGVDVLQLVVRVPQLLLVSSGSAVQVLVDLVNALPGEKGLTQACSFEACQVPCDSAASSTQPKLLPWLYNA